MWSFLVPPLILQPSRHITHICNPTLPSANSTNSRLSLPLILSASICPTTFLANPSPLISQVFAIPLSLSTPLFAWNAVALLFLKPWLVRLRFAVEVSRWSASLHFSTTTLNALHTPAVMLTMIQGHSSLSSSWFLCLATVKNRSKVVLIDNSIEIGMLIKLSLRQM